MLTSGPPRATVFVSNLSSDHDYTATAAFGALRPVTMGMFPIFKVGRLIDEIVQALSHSTPQDYLILAGSSVVSSLCLTIWMQRHGQCQILLFDRGSNRYTMRILTSEQIEAAFHYADDHKDQDPAA